jgi:hypothetical protein
LALAQENAADEIAACNHKYSKAHARVFLYSAAGGTMTKRYRVESYDAYDIPDLHWYHQGEFDTAAEALRCAQNVVRGSLEGLYRANKRPDAEGLMMAYLCHGEVPSIFGEPKVDFHAYHFAAEHIAKIMAWYGVGAA